MWKISSDAYKPFIRCTADRQDFWSMAVLVLFNLSKIPSHQIFGHMHEALNMEKNQLHILHINCETNFFSLITP